MGQKAVELRQNDYDRKLDLVKLAFRHPAADLDTSQRRAGPGASRSSNSTR